MKTEQRTWTQARGWAPSTPGALAQTAQLVLAFGATAALKDHRLAGSIRASYPAAHILGCSTAGEICGAQVFDDPLVATAIHFEHTQIRPAQVSLDANTDS